MNVEFRSIGRADCNAGRLPMDLGLRWRLMPASAALLKPDGYCTAPAARGAAHRAAKHPPDTDADGAAGRNAKLLAALHLRRLWQLLLADHLPVTNNREE